MTASFRAAAAANNGTGSTSLTLSRPTGTADGDALYMTITARGGTGTTITPPGKIAAQTSSFGSTQINDVASNGSNMFVAVGNTAKLATSSDGNTWTQNTNHPFTGNIQVVAYGAGTWFAVDDQAIVASTTSPTGTWTQRTGSWSGSLIGAFAEYVNGFYVFGGFPRQVWYSSDTITWSQPSARPGTGSDVPAGIAYANGYYAIANNVAATGACDVWYTTTISGTWTKGATSVLGSAVGGYGPAFRNGMWVVASRNEVTNKGFAYRFASDPTGSFTLQTSTPFSGSSHTQHMKATAEGFVQAAGVTGTPGELAYSADGITWRLVDTSAVTDALFSAAWDDTQAVIVTAGAAGKLGSGGRQWVLLSRQNSTTVLGQAVFFRIANKEQASYGITLTSAKASGIVAAFQNATAPEALGIGSQVNASSANIVAPATGTWSIYTSGVDVFFGGTAFGTTVTPPATYTEPTNGEASSTPSDNTATTTELSYLAVPYATSEGSLTGVAGSAAVNIGHHIFVPDPTTITGTFTADATVVTWSRWSSTWSNTVSAGAGSFTVNAIIKRTVGLTYRDVVIGDGPLGYWRLAESSGTTMVDSSGNARDGTYTGSPTLGATGLLRNDPNTAATFDKNVPSYGQVTNSGWSASSSQTLEAWADVALPISGNYGVAGFRAVSDGPNAFYINQLSGGTWEARRIDSTGGSFIDCSATVTAGIHHLALVYNNATLRLTFYIDGRQVDDKGASGTFGATTNLRIGSEGDTSYRSGTVDEVAFYDQHLTAAQILSHYAAGVGSGPRTLTADAIIKKTQSASFTADAIIRKTISASFTADAVIKKTVSASFTVDAVIKKTQSASLTADAIIKATISGSFTANAIIKATQSASFTANAVIKKTQTGSFTADAVIKTTVASSFTANAVIVRTISGSFTADAIVFKTQTASFTSDAIVFKTQTASFTADAILRRTVSASFTADAVVLRVTTISGSFTADAVIKATVSASVTADAVIKATIASSFTANAVILRTVAQAFTADAILFATSTRSFSADAVIKATASASFTANAVIKTTVSASFTADAILRRTVSGSFTANAVVMPSFTIDARIVLGANQISIDAVIKRTQSRTFDAQAIVNRTASATLTADAVLRRTVASSYTIDAIQLKTASSSVTANAVVRATRTAGATIDAVIVSLHAASFTVDAVIFRQQQRQLVVDAVLQKTIQGQLSLDATLRLPHVGSLLVDAVIVGGAHSFTVDAQIRRVGSGSFVASAFLIAQPTQFEPIVAINTADVISGPPTAETTNAVNTADVISATSVADTMTAQNAADMITGVYE